MQQFILAVLISILNLSILTAQPSEATIYWDKDRPIKWSDFKAKPVKSSPYDAQTQGSLNYVFDNNGPGAYTFKLYVKFDKQKSWSKPEEQNDNLLKHEQGHFDIYEIYGRIIMKRLKEAKVFSSDKFSERVQKIFNKAFDELQKFQQKYDSETKHSKDKEKQAEWNKKLENMLKELDEYKVKEVEFKV